MHTVMIILAGLVLLAVFVVFARIASIRFARLLPVYLVVWLICTAINMWIGVSQAGYSVMQELPFLLIVFTVPALVAILWSRKN
ncbi:MAG: hypothetical protein ACTJG4_08055 [Vreelandella alkaliphila]|uniref:Uncharacterized protein n=1 Tax=Vreelandella venusta TaxID=44935 RepID=A0AAP9ZES4_9GAMM|nr:MULTISPECIES: hypothetical protein [Halomonas]HBP42697.1 hypothetical protein [Halomonas sp.]AZM95298.1 hypothetical protein EI420_06165 [Halomonas venusta]MDW0360633.1 hypothetical protein [Halomonas venusta]NPT29815.1 hypothetical protein [Halomonas venusta]QPI65265.1 hypothetical protein IR195_06030 [Halomonas venusta]